MTGQKCSSHGCFLVHWSCFVFFFLRVQADTVGHRLLILSLLLCRILFLAIFSVHATTDVDAMVAEIFCERIGLEQRQG